MRLKVNTPLPVVVDICFDSQIKAVLGRFCLFMHEGSFDFQSQMRSRVLDLSTEAARVGSALRKHQQFLPRLHEQRHWNFGIPYRASATTCLTDKPGSAASVKLCSKTR